MQLDLLFVVDILIGASLLVVGAATLVRNSHLVLNQTLFIFAAASSFWIISNYLSNDQSLSYELVLVSNRLTLLFPGMAMTALVAFVGILAHSKFFLKRAKIILPANVLAFLLVLTPLVVASVQKQGTVYAITFGVASPAYFLVMFVDLFIVGALLINGIRRASGVEKLRLQTIGWAALFFLGVNFITNAILPFFSGAFGLTNLGPLSTAVMVFGLLYSITKYRLFDIRLAIARSLAFALSLAFIGLSYGLLVFFISSLSLLRGQSGIAVRFEYIGFALLAAILYPKIRQFFAKTTDKFLYQDAYDTQTFLGQLNQALVNNIELGSLLKKSSQIISDNLRAGYCLFGIKETSFKEVRIFGTVVKKFDAEDIARARQITPHLGTNIIVTDYLPAGTNLLKRILAKNDIAVLVRLVPEFASSKDGLEGLGYLMIGPKRSGNAYTSEDIRMLGIISNELVIAIQNALHFEEIQRFNATLQAEVAEATRRLRKTNQRLIELDETKDDFISMASHQLRTPLTSVKGYLSMVLEGDAGKLNDTQTKMLSQAFTSSQRMVFLITDLLNVSRLKTGKFVIDPAPVDLSTMIQGEIAQLTETAQAKNLELTYQKPASFPKLMLDETKTRQVIMNFIDNAIYYTPEGGHIRIELTDKPATVELRVVDDGIGVPKGEQHHLFTKFYRAANARKARPDGTGLGLFMAKKVIIAQGGSVLFESKENQGSTFGFVFSKSKLKVTTGTGPEKPAPSEAAKALAAAEV